MKYKHLVVGAFWLILLAGILPAKMNSARAQDQWSPIFRLSTNYGKASEAYSVADQFGLVHVFWTEELADQRSIIQYASYDGETWSAPADIRVVEAFKVVGNVSPAIGGDGTLHLAWNEGPSGPAYYTRAPAYDAGSAQKWEPPRLLKVPANRIKLQVDSKGVIHILYIKFLAEEPGVYYMRSEDQGSSWSAPRRLDPDIPPDYGPRALSFEIDDFDGLHAAWYYVPREDIGGDWVRYAHSLDGGDSWSEPFTIDRLDEAALKNDESLSAAGPVMAVQGRNVHIVWAGGKLHYRHHRYSTDAGETWSPSRRILGELNGQAFDGMAVDAAGRIHYFAQIRFPMGIYHAIWADGQWTRPALFYLIQYTSEDPVGDKIGAHYTHPAVRSGNQLVLTFTDEPTHPNRRLFVMERVLDEIPALEPVPTPTPLSVSETVSAAPTALPETAVATRSFERNPAEPSKRTPGGPLLLGFIATLLLAGGTITVRLLKIKD